MSDDIATRIDALIPADEVHSHPLVWRARNIDLALLIDARNEIRALRLENEALRRANAGMVGRAEHARVVGDLTRETERLRARVAELEAALKYADCGCDERILRCGGHHCPRAFKLSERDATL